MEIEDFAGYEELNLKVPVSARPYVSAVYGFLKEADRLLEFKVSESMRKEFIDLMENTIEYSLKAGQQYQKEKDYKIIENKQKEIDSMIKICRKIVKERENGINVN